MTAEDITTFWLGCFDLEADSSTDGLLQRVKDAKHPAAREIAGLAAWRDFSQGSLAISATKERLRPGALWDAAHVTHIFRDTKRPKRSTLVAFGKAAGMTAFHFSCVYEQMTPEGLNAAYPDDMPIDEWIPLEEMRPLTTSPNPLEQVRDILSSTANRQLRSETLHKVNLGCERLFATHYRSRSPDEQVAPYGVRREVQLKAGVLQSALEHLIDFKSYVRNDPAHIITLEQTLVRAFTALYRISEPRNIFLDTLLAQGKPYHEALKIASRVPRLESKHMNAILTVIESTLSAAGFRTAGMRQRLEDDFNYQHYCMHPPESIDADIKEAEKEADEIKNADAAYEAAEAEIAASRGVA